MSSLVCMQGVVGSMVENFTAESRALDAITDGFFSDLKNGLIFKTQKATHDGCA